MKNTLFPGRPNYTGPTKGWFGFIHHATLFEYSHDITERVSFIRKNKPKNEIPTRLNHLISLAALSSFLDSFQPKRDALDQEFRPKWDALDQEYQPKWDALDQEHQSKRHVLKQEFQQRSALDREYQPAVLSYIKQHISDCAWNGAQLQFP